MVTAVHPEHTRDHDADITRPQRRRRRLPLDERQRRMLSVFGADATDAALPTFRAVLVREVDHLFGRVVLPVVQAAWPDVDNSAFFRKWRGGFELYCGLGLSTLVCSARRPAVVHHLSRLMARLGASEAAVVDVAAVALPALFRLQERAACERTALGAAWILVLDEAFDDGLPGLSLDERAAVLRAVVRGMAPAEASGSVRAAVALGNALRARFRSDDDRCTFEALLTAADGWIEGEVCCSRGAPDPDGSAWRMAGVTSSMDMLLWGVRHRAGPTERELLYRIAEVGQIVDDWLDIEKDEAQGRTTPAITGVWNDDDIHRVATRAEAVLHALATAAGEPVDGVFRRLLVRTFRGELVRMARVLVEHP